MSVGVDESWNDGLSGDVDDARPGRDGDGIDRADRADPISLDEDVRGLENFILIRRIHRDDARSAQDHHAFWRSSRTLDHVIRDLGVRFRPLQGWPRDRGAPFSGRLGRPEADGTQFLSKQTRAERPPDGSPAPDEKEFVDADVGHLCDGHARSRYVDRHGVAGGRRHGHDEQLGGDGRQNMLAVGRKSNLGGGCGLRSIRLAHDLEVDTLVGPVEANRKKTVARIHIDAIGFQTEVRAPETAGLKDGFDLAARH